MRIFSFSNRDADGRLHGGPGGVNYRLFYANEEYGLWAESYYIFSNMIIEPAQIVPHNRSMKSISELIADLKILSSTYHFCIDDIYLFHDVMYAAAFSEIFPEYRSILIYHQQGSLASEYKANGTIEDSDIKVLDQLLLTVFSRIKNIVFPSKGAMDALIDTLPAMKDVLKDHKNIRIAYNGCDLPKEHRMLTQEHQQLFHSISDFDGIKLISVSDLNTAKGVERLPEYLYSLKNSGIDFRWVIIGTGAMGDTLQKEIDRYDLSNQIIWRKDTFDNAEILCLEGLMDFYIMAHRLSIFDFATVEAMHMGCVPVLTTVGGNIEFLNYDNGIAISDLSDATPLVNLIHSGNLPARKKQNITVAEENFSEKSFLLNYDQIIHEIAG